MIDPRISLAVQQASVTPAINLFNQARQSQRQAQFDPLKMQLMQQQVDQGQAQAQDDERVRDMSNISDFFEINQGLFAQGNMPQLQESIARSNLSEQNKREAQEILNTQGSQALGERFGAVNQMVRRKTGQIKPVQFGAQQTFKDNQGNLFFGTQKRNPATGQVETAFSSISGDQSMQPQGQLSLVSGLGQTAQEKQTQEIDTTEKVEEIKASAQGKSAAVKAGVGQAVKAFEKIPLVTTAINNYNEAIAALDAGAETGTIDQFMPSLTRASKELDNVIKRLGLDVVGNTTFGALSESELKFALKAAIPDNLQPAELKQWLTAKRNAQQKILGGLNEMANFLGGGEKTIADWNQQQAIKSLSGETEQEAAQPAQPKAATPTIAEDTVNVPEFLQRPTVQVGKFTVEEVD